MTATQVVTPVARLLQGSLYTGNTTNADGKPLVTKDGEPRTEWYFAIGIPKGSESHWNQTPWGKSIWDVGCEAFKNAAANPNFAWKIIDGDSTVPNKNNVCPCDREGWARNWILNLSCGFAPKIYNFDGSEPMNTPDAINLGDWIQVLINVTGNRSQQSNGVYLNHHMVAFQGYGERITVSVDPKSVGFGGAPKPAGVSASPVAGLPTASTATVAALTPAPATTVPHTAILNTPVPPAAAAPPPAARGKTMTAKANAIPYESFITQGWTDVQLIAEGYLLP